jgi:hypothetical protein
MTNQQHPITPPSKRFKQWEDDILNERDNVDHVLDCAWRHGFLAGVDQELEACLMEIRDGAGRIYIDETRLRVLLAEDIWTARRPKPVSLKEQALALLEKAEDPNWDINDFSIVRKALEQLND